MRWPWLSETSSEPSGSTASPDGQGSRSEATVNRPPSRTRSRPVARPLTFAPGQQGGPGGEPRPPRADHDDVVGLLVPGRRQYDGGIEAAVGPQAGFERWQRAMVDGRGPDELLDRLQRPVHVGFSSG